MCGKFQWYMQHVVTSSVEIFFLSTQVVSDPWEFHQSPPKSLHVENFILHVILCPIIHNYKDILGFTLNNSYLGLRNIPFPIISALLSKYTWELKSEYYLSFFSWPRWGCPTQALHCDGSYPRRTFRWMYRRKRKFFTPLEIESSRP